MTTNPLPTAPVAAPAGPPSVHVRAVLTWVAIYPLVLIGFSVVTPLTPGWPVALRILVLTLVVVPTAVYLVMPQLMKAYGALARRRVRRG